MAYITLPEGLPGIRGLLSFSPGNPEFFREVGKRTSKLGYVNPDYSKPVRE